MQDFHHFVFSQAEEKNCQKNRGSRARVCRKSGPSSRSPRRHAKLPRETRALPPFVSRRRKNSRARSLSRIQSIFFCVFLYFTKNSNKKIIIFIFLQKKKTKNQRFFRQKNFLRKLWEIADKDFREERKKLRKIYEEFLKNDGIRKRNWKSPWMSAHKFR